MKKREVFESFCIECGYKAGRVIVEIDDKGVGRNKPERDIPKQCPDCKSGLTRRYV